MRRARPMTKTNHFKCDGAIETFLPRAIHDALSAAPDFLQQLVIAEIHLHSLRFRRLVIERAKTGPEQTNAAKSVRCVRKNSRSAFCARSAGFCYHRPESIS